MNLGASQNSPVELSAGTPVIISWSPHILRIPKNLLAPTDRTRLCISSRLKVLTPSGTSRPGLQKLCCKSRLLNNTEPSARLSPQPKLNPKPEARLNLRPKRNPEPIPGSKANAKVMLSQACLAETRPTHFRLECFRGKVQGVERTLSATNRTRVYAVNTCTHICVLAYLHLEL